MTKEKKKMSTGKKVLIAVIILIIVAAATVFLVLHLQLAAQDKHMARQYELYQSATTVAIDAVNRGKVQKIES